MESKPKQILTLCLIHDDNRVLLGKKKRGFGEGWWNGFGGKVMPDETIEEGMIREVLEESGLALTDHKKLGVIHFCFPDMIHEAHIFRGYPKHYDFIESEEMAPAWFDFDQIPYENMWPDDKDWLPLLLEGLYFRAKYDFNHDKVLQGGSVWQVSKEDLENNEN
jgi:8-oxo-dGTP pyrophosphatase MutT (NUDIX family)